MSIETININCFQFNFDFESYSIYVLKAISYPPMPRCFYVKKKMKKIP